MFIAHFYFRYLQSDYYETRTSCCKIEFETHLHFILDIFFRFCGRFLYATGVFWSACVMKVM